MNNPLTSKKFWYAVGTAIVTLLANWLGLPEDQLGYVVFTGLALILGQGFADFGKEGSLQAKAKTGNPLLSRKFWYAVATIAVNLLASTIGIPEDKIMYIVGIGLTLIFGQGIADFGKEAKRAKKSAS